MKHGDPSLTHWGVDASHKVLPKCCVAECENDHYAKGFCKFHWKRNRNGIPLDAPYNLVGTRPRSGSTLGDNGYVLKWWYLGNGKTVTQLEHRFVMEQHLGRKLLRAENVHHINGVRHGNRVENLEVWNTSQPAGQRIQDKVDWAIEILQLYAPEVLRVEK